MQIKECKTITLQHAKHLMFNSTFLLSYFSMTRIDGCKLLQLDRKVQLAQEEYFGLSETLWLPIHSLQCCTLLQTHESNIIFTNKTLSLLLLSKYCHADGMMTAAAWHYCVITSSGQMMTACAWPTHTAATCQEGGCYLAILSLLDIALQVATEEFTMIIPVS